MLKQTELTVYTIENSLVNQIIYMVNSYITKSW